ncbi:MAG: flagellar basal body P-ring formation protein FlgA, partial [Synergistaceae bacterium]|nr:flagellar basal body P-ring formation protein FlgA [Synergistaceae bacterium]
IKSISAWNGGLEISTNNAPVPEGKLIEPASIVPGTNAAILRFQDKNGKINSLPVRMNWTQTAMIAARNIKRGDRIRPEDLFSRSVRITRPGMYASTPNEIAGSIANRNIQQGEPILLSSLSSSNLIKRGRQVKILARFGAASATVDGMLMEDGRPGDIVKVRRLDNRKIVLRAKIINENLVEVNVE